MSAKEPNTEAGASLFDETRLRALRAGAARSVAIEVVRETGSTNVDLVQRLPQLQGALLRVAEHQTAGKGRAGRSWHSSPGSGLTFSLAWHFSQSRRHLLGLPLAVGVALAEALQQMALPVRLKWPNDLLKEQKKLGGILIETAPAEQGGTWAVIGVGLNLAVPDALESAIGQTVADAPWLAQMDRNQLLANLLNALAHAMSEFERDGFASFVARWNQYHAFAQQQVRILDGGTMIAQGRAIGVDQQGCLLIENDSGVHSILAGDVSLRPLADTAVEAVASSGTGPAATT